MATETKKTAEKVEETVEKKVTIKLEKSRLNKEDEWVAVNGNSYLIKRGEYVEVPASVAEVLQHREEMLAVAMEFEDQAKGNGEDK
jgi:ribosomal protein L18E